MQDQLQQNSDDKQYFDIKNPSNPDPTSRPLINNEPLQADPMVSAQSDSSIVASEPSSDPISSVPDTLPSSEVTNEENPSKNLTNPVGEPLSTRSDETVSQPGESSSESSSQVDPMLESSPASDSSGPMSATSNEAVASVELNANPDEIIYKETAPEHPADEMPDKGVTENDSAGEASLGESLSASVGSGQPLEVSDNSQQPEHEAAESMSLSEHSEEAVPQPTTQDVSQVGQGDSAPAQAATQVSQSTPVKGHGFFKANLALKIALSILFLAVIATAAYFVYKYKSGQ